MENINNVVNNEVQDTTGTKSDSLIQITIEGDLK